MCLTRLTIPLIANRHNINNMYIYISQSHKGFTSQLEAMSQTSLTVPRPNSRYDTFSINGLAMSLPMREAVIHVASSFAKALPCPSMGKIRTRATTVYHTIWGISLAQVAHGKCLQTVLDLNHQESCPRKLPWVASQGLGTLSQFLRSVTFLSFQYC